jgi:hypothetical protein
VEYSLAQGSKDWRRLYQHRSGVEGTMNRAANKVGFRKARHCGHKKAELEIYLGATGVRLDMPPRRPVSIL